MRIGGDISARAGCPSPEKRAFYDRADVDTALRTIAYPVRAYLCQCTYWHITSMDPDHFPEVAPPPPPPRVKGPAPRSWEDWELALLDEDLSVNQIATRTGRTNRAVHKKLAQRRDDV